MGDYRKNIVTLLSKKVKPDIATRYENEIYRLTTRTDPTNIISSYKRIAYEKVGQLLAAASEDERTYIIIDMQCNNLGWDSGVYDDFREKHYKTLDRVQQRPKAIKGMYICKNKNPATGIVCGSDLMYVWQQQTRSSDEGMTTFRQCAKCGKRGKE